MDLNADGFTDILSGSYSRMEGEMAGLFQVLYGSKDGGFQPPVELRGTDGEPLICPGSGDETMTDRICTRPTAVDLDGDGDLDIVTGNFTGTFFVFEGEGGGKFKATATLLVGADGPLRVDAHSDPFFVDWDGDGDLDLVSGSSAGGVFLFDNEGSKEKAWYGPRQTLVDSIGHASPGPVFGDEHISAPAGATRVHVDDVDGDGKLDLLIGDMTQIHTPAPGLDADTARQKLAALDAEQQKILGGWGNGADNPTEEEMEEINQKFTELMQRRNEICTSEMTGFVWLLKQK